MQLTVKISIFCHNRRFYVFTVQSVYCALTVRKNIDDLTITILTGVVAAMDNDQQFGVEEIGQVSPRYSVARAIEQIILMIDENRRTTRGYLHHLLIYLKNEALPRGTYESGKLGIV